MLLITRGIEARSDVAVFADFSQHFIAAGLVDRKRQSKDMVDETWLLWLRLSIRGNRYLRSTLGTTWRLGDRRSCVSSSSMTEM